MSTTTQRLVALAEECLPLEHARYHEEPSPVTACARQEWTSRDYWKKPLRERLLRRVVVNPATGCWEWQGCVNSAGYGQIRYSGRLLYTHRATFEFARGPIPDGMQLDHLCRVRHCCNPDHLEAVTPQVNTLRGTSPGALTTQTNTCHRGHDMANAYVRPDGTGRMCRECRLQRTAVRQR